MRSGIELRDEGGAALIIALGVLSIMVIIGITVTAVTLNSTKTVSHDIRISEAQNVAEAGVDDAIALTLENYSDVYPGGVFPTPTTGDGEPFFDAPQQLTDNQGNVLGAYEVWTKEDPDRPGNVLITSTGTMGVDGLETSTVRVSVKYTAKIFDYLLLVGDPDASYESGGHGSDDSDDVDGDDSDDAHCSPRLQIDASNGAATLTGKVHVNGCLQLHVGDHRSHGNPGVVAFLSRDGYTDTVTYTDNYQGDSPTGNQPTQVSEPVTFPTVDFEAFTDVVTVDLPQNGVPADPGWTRSGSGSGSRFYISASDFQNNYGSYEAVKLLAGSDREYRVEITGSHDADNSDVITSSILVPAGSGSEPSIKELKLKGPGLSLQPTNGLGIITAQGEVNLEDGMTVGTPGAGVLIYCTGHNNQSMFNMESGTTLYGSVVVSPPEVELNATGSGGGSSSDDSDDVTGAIDMTYDAAFLDNMPMDWWSGGSVTAIKENFERD